MINVFTDIEKFQPELMDVARLFLPVAQDIEAKHSSDISGGCWVDNVSVFADGREKTIKRSVQAYEGEDELTYIRLRKRACKQALYYALKEATGYTPPWGSLTGIRPTRLVYEAMNDGLTLDEAISSVIDRFDVREDNAKLLGQICKMQEGIYDTGSEGLDVYIGIPFCLTRCTYCSFAATDLKHGKKLIAPYVDALVKEIEAAALDMRKMGRKIRCLYMGGGTPTSLSAAQLERVLKTARDGFEIEGEITVEAGRPDTIDLDKLNVIKNAGTTRISINPQTMNDKTLELIGRKHSAQDIRDAFLMARDLGFDNINADIIAALPGEDKNDLKYTLDELIKIRPESLTVHTLAIKRSSALHSEEYKQTDPDEAQEMVLMARKAALDNGYMPYYLYRQKYMAGNLENVGYSLPGFQCVYNIDIMEETTPILAFGAGAISKWTYDRARRIERAPNLKNIELYTARIDEMIERKRKLYE